MWVTTIERHYNLMSHVMNSLLVEGSTSNNNRKGFAKCGFQDDEKDDDVHLKVVSIER